jgi:NAD(P)-dependent dehydrogenase (short-subunit alcohol dehydrogenase family)
MQFWNGTNQFRYLPADNTADDGGITAVVGLTKNSAETYGPRSLRFNAVAPGPTITNIVATWGSELAAERLGPLLQATVPTPATAAQLAASIIFLLSDDGTNINGAILASDGGWSALRVAASPPCLQRRRNTRLQS